MSERTTTGDLDVHELPRWLRRIEAAQERMEARIGALERGAPPPPHSGGGVAVRVAASDRDDDRAAWEEVRRDIAELKMHATAPDAQARLDLDALQSRVARVEDLAARVAALEERSPGTSDGVLRPQPTAALDALRKDVESMRGQLRALTVANKASPSQVAAASPPPGAAGGAPSAVVADLEKRLQSLEKRKAPVVKVGKVEVPFEISGIVAGLIAIAIGAMVLVTGESFSPSRSPWFVVAVGALLIGASVMKAILTVKQNKDTGTVRIQR